MLSLKEFERLPTEELCIRMNEMLRVPSHYTPDVMAEHGYSFTWASMKRVANDRGLVEGFYDPTCTGVRIVYPGDDGLELLLKDKEAYTRRTLAIEKDTAEKLGRVLGTVAGSYNRGALLTAIVESGLEVLENARAAGKLTVTAANLTIKEEE